MTPGPEIPEMPTGRGPPTFLLFKLRRNELEIPSNTPLSLPCTLDPITSHSYVAITIMPSDAVLNLSFFELLKALNEKLALECAKVQGVRFPSADGLEFEVSAPSPILLNGSGMSLTVNPSD